tara:strand:+ start:991 stop:1197 length:207 start_codon:yes stop_codon:yes gene_type:complete
MNADDIKSFIRTGGRVFWKNRMYEVQQHQLRSGNDQWLIVCAHNNHAIGLTHQDGRTLNGAESDFFTI